MRDGPPFVMTDMMAAEPALAERLLTRLAAARVEAAVLAGRLRDGGRAPRSPIRVVGCGTSEHGAMASALILEDALWQDRPARCASRPSRPSKPRSLRRPGGLIIGVSHEGGTAATNARHLRRLATPAP